MARRLLATCAAVLLALGVATPAMPNDLPDPVNPTAVLSLTKTASPAEAGPGDTVVFTLQVGCSAIADVGCRDAITTDTVPEPFEIVSVTSSGANDAADPVIAGQDVTVTWTEPLSDGVVGMLDNTTSEVLITVRVPEDVSYDFNGETVTNQALAEATNATDVPASVPVTINVPLNLDTSATKAFDPDSALGAGTAVTASLTGTNDSNATVDTLVIQDPTDPAATPNPFTYLGFTGFGTVTPPAGTTSTTYEVYVDGAWVPAPDGQLPAGVDPQDVQGTRVTFTGAIPAGATGSVDLDLETTDAAAAVTDDTTITNTIQSEVTLDGDNATGTASDDFTLQANNIVVEASKSFDPETVVAGESTVATIGGRNGSAIDIGSMTITEPSSGSFPDEYTFGGFTAGIDYPAGATSGTVTYQPSGDAVNFSDGGTPGPPSGGFGSVTSFQVVFTGAIEPGAETSISFGLDTNPDLDPADLPTTVTNEVGVQGENEGATDSDTAQDGLFIYGEVIEPYVDKQIRPSQIIANPGEIATVTLQGGTTERPNPPDDPTGTTGDADQIVIQDPTDPIEGDAWWNAFDLESITQTPIPADATLTVYYYDTTDGTWKVLDGPVAGPANYNYDVPDDISDAAGGVRFVYDYTGSGTGFAPGTDLAPNFTASLRPEGRYDGATPPYNTDPDNPNTTIPDCAQADASSPTPGVPGGNATMAGGDCPAIDIVPPNGGGGGGGGGGAGDLIAKEFGTSSGGGDKSVVARSGATIPSTLHWSTGGYSNFETVDVTDIANAETTPVADSVYDAFDLTRIEAISNATDPLIKYDEVTHVLLWNGTTWTEAANSPCDTGGCLGQMPAVNLTPAEQASTLAVRLTFAERPDRAAVIVGDLDAPPVGSGVARSFGNNREITLVWQVRDTKRSDGSPVLGEDLYNLADAGLVRNTVNATGHPATGQPVSDDASDDVLITDVPITTTTVKTWEGGPLGVPVPGTPADQYPLSEMTVTTTNTTPAMVDQLQITDPGPGSITSPQTDPFLSFTLNNFAEITEPPGTQSTTITLTCPDGSRPTFTRDEALALTPAAMPCDVIGVQVLFDGRIASGAAGIIGLDMRLRAQSRVTGEPITADDSPISNTAQGIVADVDAIQDCPPAQDARYACDQDTATIDLAEATFGITAGKSIAPATQKEGDRSPVTVTVSAQNSGSAHPYSDAITDEDPTFWNAVDFVQMDPTWVLPEPVKFVQACYLSGGSFTAANVEADSVGGDYTCQVLPPGPPFQPGDLSLDEARQFINDAAQANDIHGLRFLFMAGTEVGWQNPSNPLIQIPFQVQRRVDLRTGGPVPTTRSDQDPAPGEDVAGVFVDTVEVEGVSVLVEADTRLTASDTADADYTHQHLTVGVEVDKGPSGQVLPGQVIPFTLTYRNTGESPLTNPVFTDVLPSDATGNQLIFDPEEIGSPYSFALSGGAPSPPNGDPLPTAEADITITQAGDTITFEMPDGSVMEPGQTYTITIELMLRPGLTPDDLVTNTDRITADEPFDAGLCSPNYDAATGACWDDTTVSPIRVAALGTVKAVKADVPVNEAGIPEIYLDRGALPAGVTVPDDYCDTAADADGFYRSPCVPVTYPGDTETWKFTITNSGTLPIDQLVAIDALPIPDDTGVILVDFPRESAWQPTFADGLDVTTNKSNAITSLWYTPTHSPLTCTDDLDPLGPPCPAGSWLPYDGTVDDSVVGSVKVRIDFGVNTFNPGEQVTVLFKTTTTPTDLVPSSFPVAWNTVATGGRFVDGSVTGTAAATEGRKVGITYPTGPIQLQKIVSGEGAPYAPDTFTVQPTCTVNGQAIAGISEVTLTPGADPTEIDGLPWGAECTAAETGQGQTSHVIGTATVGGPQDEIGLVTIENVFELGDMTVTKSVDSSAVDQDGDPITYGPFQVHVTCTFLGEQVFAAGYDADNPMTFTIADGQTVTLADLPVGATCVTTEPPPGNAGAAATISPTSVTIGGPGQDPVAVTVTNHFDVGSLTLVKQVSGEALNNDPALRAGPFVLHVVCTLTDASHPGGTVVYDDAVTLTGVAPGDTTTIDNLPTGAVCVVTETDTGGATTNAIDPTSVTIGVDTAVTVTASNVFEAGSMTVTKSVDSDAVDQDGNPIAYGPFQVAVSCTFEGQNVFGDGYSAATPMVHTIAAMETWTITGLPVGATCTTTEPDDADAATQNIAPPTPVTIGGPDLDPTVVVAVTVTNHYDVGSLQLVKVVDGAALDNNPVVGLGPFTLHVTCSLTDASHTGVTVYNDDVLLEGAQPLAATIDNLPTGAVCDVTEPETGGATSFTIDPDRVTIGADTTVEVTATNTFETGSMTVTKTVDSNAVDQDGNPIPYGPFQVHVSCTFNGDPVFADGYDADTPMTFTIEDGQIVTLEGLPVGAICVTTEPGDADAVAVDISPPAVTIGGPDQDPAFVEAVTVTNPYDVGSLHVRKLVLPAAVEQFAISQGPFTLHVVCTLTDASHPDGTVVYDGDLVLQGPQPLEATIDDLAAGALCVVTEPEPGAATLHLVEPRSVMVGADDTVNVVATNLFGASVLTVSKTVDGPGASRYGAGPFEVSLSCTYTDASGQQVPLDTPGGATRQLTQDNGYTAAYEPLLFGSTCQIEETRTGGATSSAITDADGQPVRQITIDSLYQELEISVTNTFDVGAIDVIKHVVGAGPDRFEVELTCTGDIDGTSTPVDVPDGATRELAEARGFTTSYTDLPTGANCRLVETDDGDAVATEITPNGGDPKVGLVTVGNGTTVTLAVQNTFPDTFPDTSPDENGHLPPTGADRSLLAVLIAGLVLLGAGVMLIGGTRRRRS